MSQAFGSGKDRAYKVMVEVARSQRQARFERGYGNGLGGSRRYRAMIKQILICL